MTRQLKRAEDVLKDLQVGRSDDSGDSETHTENEKDDELDLSVEFSDLATSDDDVSEVDVWIAPIGRGSNGRGRVTRGVIRGAPRCRTIRGRACGRGLSNDRFDDLNTESVCYGPQNDPELHTAKNGTRWYEMQLGDATRV